MAASFPTSIKTWTDVVDNVDTILAAHINDAYAEIIAIETVLDGSTYARYKNSTGTFASGGTTHTVTDSFITVNTQVIISPTSAKIGSWSVESAAGSFTITSDSTETTNVTFDWSATK